MTQLWVERTGTRRYIGRSTRGRRCWLAPRTSTGYSPRRAAQDRTRRMQRMASDQPLARRLGDDYQAVVKVSGAADRDQERYPLIEETMELDLSGLTEDEKERLLVVINRAVELACTVGRTLKSGTTVNLEVVDVGA